MLLFIVTNFIDIAIKMLITMSIKSQLLKYVAFVVEHFISNNREKCRGRLTQWKTVRFVKIFGLRLWFESRRTPSLFHARNFANRQNPESLKYVGVILQSQYRNSKVPSSITQPLK